MLKKIICMVLSMAALLGMAAYCGQIYAAEPISTKFESITRPMIHGACPMESYLEWHEHDGIGGLCRGITFKGWEHN